jgi:hypothetical protein
MVTRRTQSCHLIEPTLRVISSMIYTHSHMLYGHNPSIIVRSHQQALRIHVQTNVHACVHTLHTHTDTYIYRCIFTYTHIPYHWVLKFNVVICVEIHKTGWERMLKNNVSTLFVTDTQTRESCWVMLVHVCISSQIFKALRRVLFKLERQYILRYHPQYVPYVGMPWLEHFIRDAVGLCLADVNPPHYRGLHPLPLLAACGGC